MAYTNMGRMMSIMRLLLALTAVAIMSSLFCYVSAQQGVASIISEDVFNQFLKHRNDAACPAKGFYTYTAFIAAANSFPDFGNNGDLESRKRELAAFFGQTSQETTGIINLASSNSSVSLPCRIVINRIRIYGFLQAGGQRPQTAHMRGVTASKIR